MWAWIWVRGLMTSPAKISAAEQIKYNVNITDGQMVSYENLFTYSAADYSANIQNK